MVSLSDTVPEVRLGDGSVLGQKGKGHENGL